MKKFHLFGLAALMVCALASCGGGGTSTGGTSAPSTGGESTTQPADFTDADYERAVNGILDYSIITKSGKTGLVPDEETSLSGDQNDYLVVTLNQLYTIRNKGNINVEISWEWDITDTHFAKTLANITDDENHKILYLNYSDQEDISGLEVEATAKAGGKEAKATYKIKLLKQNIVFEELESISKFYEIQSNGYWRFLDEKGQITGNLNADGVKQRYYYCAMPGKVVYVAKDRNFAIMSDGELSVYLFKISELDAISVGNYVKVYGEAAIYYGAVQISFISKVEVLEDHSAIAEPAEATATTAEAILTTYRQISDKHMYKVFVPGLKYVGCFDQTGNAISAIDDNARGIIRFTDGTRNFDVAYDYHTHISAGLNDAIKGATANDVFGVEGHLIFNNGDNNNKAFSKTATTWQLLPVSGSAISKAA